MFRLWYGRIGSSSQVSCPSGIPAPTAHHTSLPSALRRRRSWMKRCPLCDFIYEDDQSLCDMDGIELVHDRGELVPANAAAHAVAVKSPRKKLSVLPPVAAALGVVFFSVYYLSADGAAPTNGN